MAIKQASIKLDASKDKEKYSWEQYLGDEQERLKKLEQSPHAGKYGGGYKGKDVPKKVVETEEQKSFAFLKKIGVTPDHVPDKEVRKRYEAFLKSSENKES